MNSKLALVVAVLLLVVNLGVMVASVSRADTSAAGKYQLVIGNGHMYLFDTANGAVWQRLEYREGGNIVKDEWQPLSIAAPRPATNALIFQKAR